MKLFILDYIRGLWGAFGEYLIAILWPHIIDERIKLKQKVDSVLADVNKSSEECSTLIEEMSEQYECLADRFGKVHLENERLKKQLARLNKQPKKPKITKVK